MWRIACSPYGGGRPSPVKPAREIRRPSRRRQPDAAHTLPVSPIRPHSQVRMFRCQQTFPVSQAASFGSGRSRWVAGIHATTERSRLRLNAEAGLLPASMMQRRAPLLSQLKSRIGHIGRSLLDRSLTDFLYAPHSPRDFLGRVPWRGSSAG